MNGPTAFNWDDNWLESKTADSLHDFYKKLCRGEFYLHEDNNFDEYEVVRLPC